MSGWLLVVPYLLVISSLYYHSCRSADMNLCFPLNGRRIGILLLDILRKLFFLATPHREGKAIELSPLHMFWITGEAVLYEPYNPVLSTNSGH
ncbi:hypothetical protein [Paenibacillus polymyxa]|uniref:hypothetical protein n=1 Tax=Paenibacillus polymyxa TaxID=1406 RepID=UPI003216AF61